MSNLLREHPLLAFLLLFVTTVLLPQGPNASRATLHAEARSAADKPAPAPEPARPAPAKPSRAVPPPPAPRGMDALEVGVAGRVPLPGEAFEDRIIVFFDAPIRRAEGDEGPLLQIEPPLDGETELGGNYVAFKAVHKPERANTVYRATLSAAIEGVNGRPIAARSRVFYCANFVFEPTRVFRVDHPNEDILGLLFPIEVKPEVLSRHVSICDKNGMDIPCRPDVSTSDTACRLVLAKTPVWPVTITVAAGLPGALGRLKTAKPVTLRYPGTPYFKVEELHWGRVYPDRGEQALEIVFTQPVATPDLLAHLHVADAETGAAIPFEAVESGLAQTHVLHFLMERVREKRIVVYVKQGLPGQGGTVLKEDFEQEIPWEGPLPFRIADAEWPSWLRERYKGAAVLRLEFNKELDLKSLEKHLSVHPTVPNFELKRDYGNRFLLLGDWRSEALYEIRIAPGLTWKEYRGGTGRLDERYSHNVKSAKVGRYLDLDFEGRWYFPRKGRAAVPVESRNVAEAEVEVYRLFPSNIAVALDSLDRATNNTNDANDFYRYHDLSSIDLTRKWSEHLETRTVALSSEPDALAATDVDIGALLPPDAKGLFCLGLHAKDTTTAFRAVLWTDLGVLAHWQDDQLAVFVHDLASLAPRSLARISVYSTKNQLLGTGRTDADGLALLGPFDTAQGVPRVVVIEHEEDYTFLELEPRREGMDAIAAHLPRYDRDGYDAFVYADRELYRPGETIHARWLVRTNYGEAAPAMPVVVKVVKPNGRALSQQTVLLSEAGSGGLDIATQKVYPTGKYTIQLEIPGSARSIGSYGFSLEEFVPNRLKCETHLPEKPWFTGEHYTIEIEGAHLFGAPATDRRAEALVILEKKRFTLPQYSGYSFWNDQRFDTQRIECGEAMTDPAGKTMLDLIAPQHTAPLRVKAIGRVFELGGRSVASSDETWLFPSPKAMLGVYVAENQSEDEAVVSVCAVRPDGAPADLDRVKVTLERRIYNYNVRRYHDRYQPQFDMHYEEVTREQVALEQGLGKVRLAVPEWGSYRVRVSSPVTPHYSEQSFYAYWGWVRPTQEASPSLVKLSFDKPSYEVGGQVTLSIESPFDGRGIVVLQNERIQRILPVAIEDGTGTLEFALEEAQCPNVWVEATVVHALDKGGVELHPFASFAMADIAVTNPKRRIALTLPGLPEEIRPAQEAVFAIETRDAQGEPVSAEVTLAAVDEGIHLITGYAAPDPYAHVFRPRRPDFRRAHYYDKVAYDFLKAEPGGDASLIGKRVSVDENWIKCVALWSGVVHTDARGRAEVRFDVPEFTGQLRVAAVAATKDAVGGETGQVYVRRPHLLRTSMPRFLLPGDRASCRAVVFNNAEEACTVELRCRAEGAVVPGDWSRQLDIAAGGQQDASFECVAGAVPGPGTLHWEAVVRDGGGAVVERIAQEAKLPVRPPGSFHSEYELAVLEPGEMRAFRNTAFLDDERAETAITVSANPLLQIGDALAYCVRYPYGCVEQTTSRLMPMLLLRQSRDIARLALDDDMNLDAYIQGGIDRLLSMQTVDGGLSMWQYGRISYPYGSVYALHALTLARKTGAFDVPEHSFRALQNYVRGYAGAWNNDSLYNRAYSLFVLTLDGDLRAIEEIERFDTVDLPYTARLLLAGALGYATDDTDRVQAYLERTPSHRYEEARRDGCLNSAIRNKAVRLMVMPQLGATAEERRVAARELLAWLRTHRYGNTQETAFIVTALCGYLDDVSAQGGAPGAEIAGPDGATAEVAGFEVYTGEHEGPGGAFRVENTGGAPVYVGWTTRGVPQALELEAESHGGLEISRSVRPVQGDAQTGAYGQGDAYLVTLAIECERDFENIIVADLVPAGFEIENPRLDPDVLKGVKLPGSITPTHLEVRDDRLVLAFDELTATNCRRCEPHYYAYLVRAATPGAFTYPGIEAECMYDASIRACGPPAKIEVIQR